MISINSPAQVTQLALDDDVLNALIVEIEQPFESAIALTLFWKQTNTHLLLIEPDDDLNYLSTSDSLVAFALKYPEWTLNLPKGYQLSLAVLNDEGSGCYLLQPSRLINTE